MVTNRRKSSHKLRMIIKYPGKAATFTFQVSQQFSTFSNNFWTCFQEEAQWLFAFDSSGSFCLVKDSIVVKRGRKHQTASNNLKCLNEFDSGSP